MTKRERLAARFVADVVAGGGDTRRMSNVTHMAFTATERAELTGMAHGAIARLVARAGSGYLGDALQLMLTKSLAKSITGSARP